MGKRKTKQFRIKTEKKPTREDEFNIGGRKKHMY